MSQNKGLKVAGFFGALGVILGAFGAHGLKPRLSPALFDAFEVGVRYHIYHALALLALCAVAVRAPESKWLQRAGYLWITGIVLFSGSLYLYAVLNQKWLAMITPFGGLAFIAGWACLLFVKSTPSSE